MKKLGIFLSGAVCALLLTVLVIPALSASTSKNIAVTTDIQVYLNDIRLEPKDVNGKPVEIFVHNGTTYLPIRAVATALNLPVDYDAATRSAYVGTHKKVDTAADATALFARLAQSDFLFTSGAGAWSTEMKILADGSFSGTFHDWNAGGAEYPNGEVLISNFSGRFGDVQKISDTEYRMQVKSLTQAEKADSQWVEDGALYVAAEPYGLENAGELRVYLPGHPRDTLSEGCRSWIDPMLSWENKSELAALPRIVVCNVADECAFMQNS